LFSCGYLRFSAKYRNNLEVFMVGVVQFMRGLVMAALLMGAAGTLVEATGLVGREAAKAHQHGGIKFKWLNQQLVGGGK
jgi:hypothetical protein